MSDETMNDKKKEPDVHDDSVTEVVDGESGANSESVVQAAEDVVAESAADDAATSSAADDAVEHESDDDESIERLYTKKDVDAVEAAAQDRFLRLFAEYENFRRRTAREKERWEAEAIEGFVKDLLPVFDSFDKARATETDDAAAVLQGLEVTHKQLRGVLDKQDIEVIDPVGEAFDPRWHEALMRRPAEGAEAGTVVEVFERGYRLGTILIRAARVVVAAEES